jgi:20S proteasome alpha/beta subunit
MVDTIACLNRAIKNISIKRLLKMLCGIKQSEKIAGPLTIPIRAQTIVAGIVETDLQKGHGHLYKYQKFLP